MRMLRLSDAGMRVPSVVVPRSSGGAFRVAGIREYMTEFAAFIVTPRPRPVYRLFSIDGRSRDEAHVPSRRCFDGTRARARRRTGCGATNPRRSRGRFAGGPGTDGSHMAAARRV